MPDPAAVNSMFARIARRYDVANHLLSLGADHWWRRRLVREVAAREPNNVLDLATGSGDVAFALASRLPSNVAIIGMDFCQPMLDEALIKKQQSGRHANISFQAGDALALPLPAQSYDAVTVSFGLRNMADRHRALCEMHRVLRPGGSAFVLEFSQPYRWFRPLYLIYLRHVLPLLASLITGDRSAYDYLGGSIEDFPDHAAMTAELERSGFTRVRQRRMTFGIVALHAGVK